MRVGGNLVGRVARKRQVIDSGSVMLNLIQYRNDDSEAVHPFFYSRVVLSGILPLFAVCSPK
jgi:hypothetical protein